MRIVVVGAGGVGGYLGVRLTDAGHDVGYLVRGRNLAALRDEGISLKSPLGDRRLGPQRASDTAADLAPADLVVVTVKLYDLAALAPGLAPLIGDDTAVLPLQNGVESYSCLTAALNPASILKGVVTIKSFLDAPGEVVCKSPFCHIQLGEGDGVPTARARHIAEILDACVGVDAVQSEDIDADIWRKFVMLASFSAVTCLARATIGQVRDSADALRLAVDATAEAAAVGRALGVDLPDDVEELVDSQIRDMPKDGKASMLEDLEAGRRLELGFLSGSVVRLGKQVGIPTPLHQVAYAALAMHAGGRGE